MFTAAEKRAEALIEAQRRWLTMEDTVALGILTRDEAERSIAVMEAIARDYEEADDA